MRMKDAPRDAGWKMDALLFIGATIIYGIVWLLIAHPYRYFPCDDVAFTRFHTMLTRHPGVPALYLALHAIQWLCLHIGGDERTALLLLMVLSGSVTAGILVALIRRLTGRLGPAIAGFLIYMTSAWPATYYLMASYAPFATLLYALTFYLLVVAFIGRRFPSDGLGSRAGASLGATVLAGVISGFAALSSSSGPLVVSLLALALLFLSFNVPASVRGRFGFLLGYAFSLLLVVGPYIIIQQEAFFGALEANVGGPYLQIARAALGTELSDPFLSFLRLSYTYSPLLTVAFLVVSVLSLAAGLRGRWNDQRGRVILVLVGLVWAHALLVDVLPFTKLGRTHFAAHPFLVLAVALGTDRLVQNRGGRPPLWAHITVVAVLAGVLVTQVGFAQRMVEAKQAGSRHLADLSRRAELFFMRDDPHASFLDLSMRDLKSTVVDDLRRIPVGQGKPYVALALGPRGPMSGRSILRHASLPDFYPGRVEASIPREAVNTLLPYYAHFPAFLFENEATEALYFAGLVPDYRAADARLLVYTWDRCGLPNKEGKVTLSVGCFTGGRAANMMVHDYVSGCWWVAQPANGRLDFKAWAYGLGVGGEDKELLVGDFTGDGKDDVAIHDRRSGDWWVGVSGGQAFMPQLWVSVFGNRAEEDTFVADFTGDGKDDVAIHDRRSGDWWVGVSGGQAFMPQLWASGFGTRAEEETFVADFTGDGKADAAIHDRRSGDWWVGVSRGKGFMFQQWAAGFSIPRVEEETFVADFTGDGKADSAIHDRRSGDWWVGVSGGKGLVWHQWASGFGNRTEEETFVADFTGDGKADVAIHDQRSGDWWVGVSGEKGLMPQLWPAKTGTGADAKPFIVVLANEGRAEDAMDRAMGFERERGVQWHSTGK
jgi:hypothetical protein